MFERAICSVSVTLTTSIASKRVTARLMMLLGMCGVKYRQRKTELDPFNGESFTANFKSVRQSNLHWLSVYIPFAEVLIINLATWPIHTVMYLKCAYLRIPPSHRL